MGDDTYAPHELFMEVTPSTTLKEVTNYLIKDHYLASIAGGKATWILQSNRPLAVVAQQWEQASFLIPADTLIADCIELEQKPNLQFVYKGSADPNQLVEQLLDGKPSPNRFT